MSQSKPTDGPSRSDLQSVSRALREIAREPDPARIAELVRETSFDRATVEMVMGALEGPNTVPATRSEKPGGPLAWKLPL